MANIFTLENIDNFTEKINIDELYEKKRQHDVNQLELFKKILNRVHVRIKTCSKQKIDDKCCWFVVPEIIIGVPKYDQAACIAFIMDKLNANGFMVKYFHPNTLFINWSHWIPSYVRNELKKKTGIEVNEYGVKVDNSNKMIENGGNNSNNNSNNLNELMFNNKDTTNNVAINKNNKKYTSIDSYKPSGSLVYSEKILNKLEDKIL